MPELTYTDVKAIVELPMSQREKMNLDTKMMNARKYHLTHNEIIELREQQKQTGKFPNPYKRQGPYRAIVQALIDLGINEWHSFSTMRTKAYELMHNMILNNGRTVWDTFSKKTSRNQFSGKDLTGKMIQNTLILQRIGSLNPYGMKVAQLCACIDAKRENGVLFFRLNTSFNSAEEVKPLHST